LLGEYRVEIGAMGPPRLSSVENSTKMDSPIFKSDDVPSAVLRCRLAEPTNERYQNESNEF